MIALLLLPGLALADCPSFRPGPADAAVAQVAGGSIVLEIRLLDDAPWPGELLELLHKGGLPVVLLVSPDWALAHTAELRQHEHAEQILGLYFDGSSELAMSSDKLRSATAMTWWEPMKRARQTLRRASRTRTTVIAIKGMTGPAEIAAEALAFRTILPVGSGTEPPRMAHSYNGQPSLSRVLYEGPYRDGCGAPLPSGTPAALDRVSRASAQAGWPLRVALPEGSAPLVARWLEADLSGLTALDPARAARVQVEASSVPVTTLDAASLSAAAAGLVGVRTLPRQLPGGVSPSTAFGALARALSDATSDPVPVPALEGPLEVASTSLPERRVVLEPEQVREAASRIAPGLSGRVPAVVSVSDASGTLSLTAAEFLVAMAATYTSAPIVVLSVNDPDPFAPGGGWGSSD